MVTQKNQEFLQCVEHSFRIYLDKGTSRSTAKLKPLHGFIARDLHERLGFGFDVYAQGYGEDRERKLRGRYQGKAADISVFCEGNPVAGIAVKFVMQNYKQNSVNYFENMLGETANIRSAGLPYFQILILLDRFPYFDKNNGLLKHWENITQHNLNKYVTLSQDDPVRYPHTPDKMLIFIVHSHERADLKTKQDYLAYYQANPSLSITTHEYEAFDRGIFLNDYDSFMAKVCHTILAY